jgi:hypothetical protein
VPFWNEEVLHDAAVVSDTAARRQLSAADAYARQTLRLDDQARMQSQVAKATLVADAALRQGVITHDDHAKRLVLINQKYGEAGVAARAYAQATQVATAQVSAMAAGSGQLGSILTAIGPVRLVAAAGIGATVLALKAMSDASHELAQKSQELRPRMGPAS